MLYTQKSGLKISRLGLGTWAMGAGKDWGPADKNDCIKAIHAALDAGVNLIDTAPIYGNFRAELIVGEAIKGQRDKLVLATKCGLQPGQRAVRFDLSPKAVRAEAEDSLKRLNTDYIDIYLIHWPDKNTPLSDTLAEFEKLKSEGKIRFCGVCNFTLPQLKEACKITDINFVQNEFSFLQTERSKEIINFCEQNKKTFMAYGVLGGGILSGKYKREPCLPKCSVKSFFYKYYKGESFEKSRRAAELLSKAAQRHYGAAAQAALNYVLAQKGVDIALFGARNQQQAVQNAKAAEWAFSREELEFLNERYA